jgi:hypothetical protein
MTGDLDTTNFWLGIIAIATVLELLALGCVAWFAYSAYSRIMTRLNELETRYVAPLGDQAGLILKEVQQFVGRVNGAQHAVRTKVKQVADAGSLAAAKLRTRAWPLVGVLRGIRAGLVVLRERNRDGGRQARSTELLQAPADQSQRVADGRIPRQKALRVVVS